MLHVKIASVCTPCCTSLRVSRSHCAKFETRQSSCQALSPVQTEAILLVSNSQDCWELLRLFARGLKIAILGLCIALCFAGQVLIDCFNVKKKKFVGFYTLACFLDANYGCQG